MFTERELFLMQAAFSAGINNVSLESWLDEAITEDGATVQMSLAHDADLFSNEDIVTQMQFKDGKPLTHQDS